MSAEILNSLTTRSIALANQEPKAVKKIKLKVFWRTTNFWTDAAIKEYHNTAPAIADRLVQEQYWDKTAVSRTTNSHVKILPSDCSVSSLRHGNFQLS